MAQLCGTGSVVSPTLNVLSFSVPFLTEFWDTRSRAVIGYPFGRPRSPIRTGMSHGEDRAQAMHRLIRLFSTSIGRKLVVAVTGLMLVGFLLSHMLGNMAVFQGSEALNSYAAWLQGHPALWVLRLGLLLIFVTHIYFALQLALENRAARPTRYASSRVFQTSSASRYMVLTGLLVVLFVIGHLLHFTFGALPLDGFGQLDASGRHDVYGMVVSSFQNPWICGLYVIAMNLIGFHLAHGTRSLFQTVGVNHDSYNSSIRMVSRVLVTLFVVGNCSIPILIYFGQIGVSGG